MASQIVIYIAMGILVSLGKDYSVTQDLAVLLTGITGIVAMIPCLYLYKKDRAARISGGLIPGAPSVRLHAGEAVLLLLMGAAFSQFANMLVGLFQNFLNYQQYQESMEQITQGKSLFTLIFWMGIVAPAAEEVIFRWLIYLRLRDYMRMAAAAVISGAFFGLYHMNLLQAVYAGILGMIFAYMLETGKSLWASVLLHMGANIWSLVFSEMVLWLLERNPASILFIYVVLLCIVVFGLSYFQKRAQRMPGRMI